MSSDSQQILELLARQLHQQQEQMTLLTQLLQKQASESVVWKPFSIPKLVSFDAASELWLEYQARFRTFCDAHSIPQEKISQVFLTNQTPAIYKMLSNLAEQSKPPKQLNELLFSEITEFMKEQFDSRKFVVRERFRFWTTLKRKPGETIQEFASRIRQAASTCDFGSIIDPLDEAMRTKFICSINNEAVLKSLFKIKEDE